MQKRVVANEIIISEIARLIADGVQVTFTPKGASMLPFIRGDKDSVILKAPENIGRNDIVLAQIKPATYVVHRIIDIQGSVVTLMGDGNLVGTEKCRTEDIIAVVSRIVKDNKEIDCHSRSHIRRAEIWKRLLPVRRYILAIYKRIIL